MLYFTGITCTQETLTAFTVLFPHCYNEMGRRDCGGRCIGFGCSWRAGERAHARSCVPHCGAKHLAELIDQFLKPRRGIQSRILLFMSMGQPLFQCSSHPHFIPAE